MKAAQVNGLDVVAIPKKLKKPLEEIGVRRTRKLPCLNGFDVIEHLNAIVARISHQGVVIRINKDMKWIK